MKITGPMLSLQATGTLADTLTFQNRRGRPTVYLKPPPRKLSPVKLVNARIWVRALMQAWPAISPTDQASWEALRTHENQSLINIYLGTNMRSIWAEGPVGKTPTIGSINDPGLPAAFTGSDGVRHTEVIYKLGFVQQNWILALHREPFTPFTQNLSNLVLVKEIADTNPRTFLDSPLQVGRYYYKYKAYSAANQLRVAGAIKGFNAT